MKKLIHLFLCSLFLVLFSGCGTSNEAVELNDQKDGDLVEEVENLEENNANDRTGSSVSNNNETIESEGSGVLGSTGESNEKVESTSNLIQAPVVSVVDGDTIKVKIGQNTETVRFLLVDTPETSHPQLGKQPFGEEAKEFVKELLEGKTVELEKDVSERDKYGRLLMYVYINGKSVQEELLKNGLARVAYVYAPNTKYIDQYYEIQKEAQQKAIGIWSVENYATDKGFNPDAFEDKHPDKVENKTASDDCDIKGNINSKGEKIYHMPGQQFYDRTEIDESKGEKYFCSREEAEAHGFRPSQR